MKTALSGREEKIFGSPQPNNRNDPVLERSKDTADGHIYDRMSARIQFV